MGRHTARKVHVLQVKISGAPDQWWVVNAQGAQMWVGHADNKLAAVAKWEARFGTLAGRMISYKDRFTVIEAAITIANLKPEETEENEMC